MSNELHAKSPRPEDNDAYLVALSRLTTSLAYTGNAELADRIHARMIAALEGVTPSEPALARVRLSTALRSLRLEDRTETLACFADALEVFERIGDRRGGMYVRVNLGVIQMEFGEYESAERALREAIAAGLATGVTSIAIGARVNLGLVRAHLGAYDDGLAIMRDTVAAYAHLGDARMMGIARTYVALVLLAKGDFVDAANEAEAAAKELEAIATSRVDALAARARALVALGRKEDALAASTEAFGVLADLGTVDDGDMRIRLAHVEALLANAEIERARDVLVESVRRLEQRANKLGAELRRSFRERVPENARIMELARQHDVA